MFGCDQGVGAAGWLALTSVWVVSWVVLVAVVVTVGWMLRRGSGSRVDSPERVLAERYARGDIGHEEYIERRRNLARRLK